jgi:hypothetical protein
MKFCSNCREVVITKAFPNYSQIEYQGILVKRQKIGHLEEDGGCGCEWFTFGLAVGKTKSKLNNNNYSGSEIWMK